MCRTTEESQFESLQRRDFSLLRSVPTDTDLYAVHSDDSFLGASGRCTKLTTHLPIMPGLMSEGVPPLLLYAFMACALTALRVA